MIPLVDLRRYQDTALDGSALVITGHLTVEQAISAYPDAPHIELIDGDLHVNPAPRVAHAVAAADISRWLNTVVDLDRWYVHQTVNVRLTDDTLLIPDVIVYAIDSVTADTVAVEPEAVALVIEVLSPHEDPTRKTQRYLDAGVAAVWNVDLDARTIEAHGHCPLDGDADNLATALWDG